MDIFNFINIILASAYVLFLPGFTMSFVFFDTKKIDILERIALSFALSISIVPLTVFYLNLLGFSITAVNVIVEVLIIHSITFLILVWQRKVIR